MIFIFFSSHNQHFKQTGSYIEHCSECKQEQPHALYEISQTDAIYGIKVKDTLLSKIVACEICGNAKQINKKTVIKFGSPWTIDISIADLAHQINYVLADQSLTAVNKNSVTALVNRIASTKDSLDIAVSLVGWLCAVAGAITLGLVLGLLSHLGLNILGGDTLAHIFAGIWIGFFLGLITPTVIQLIQHNKTKRLAELKFYMSKLRIGSDEVKQYVKEMPSMNNKARDLIRLL